MRLTPFIRNNSEEIADEWVKYARDNINHADEMELEEVRDHIIQMLEKIADDMEASQTDSQQESKSKGNNETDEKDLAAEEHGAQRVELGFDIVQLSSEFRALRASVIRLWEAKISEEKGEEDFQDLMRFNEAIDEAWVRSLKRFNNEVEESKNWFLGILGHDLRNPLAAISGVQQVLQLSENLSEREKEILKRTDASVKRMDELITNLLELTNLRLGSGLNIHRSSTDLAKEIEKIIQEFEIAYPQAQFRLKAPGPVEGDWDRLRLNQVITNLVGNALRHGRPGGPVSLFLSAEGENAILAVHNEGTPIPEKLQKRIFTGMYTRTGEKAMDQSSYGLGLFIVEQIVQGHNGNVEVESTAEKGTTFTVTLPRR